MKPIALILFTCIFISPELITTATQSHKPLQITKLIKIHRSEIIAYQLMDRKSNKLPPPSKAAASAINKNFNNRWFGSPTAEAPRSHGMYRVSTTPSSRFVRGYRYDVGAPENRFRRRQTASKEIVRRALTPPCQKLSLRWRNFRPTPSRFSAVSVAE